MSVLRSAALGAFASALAACAASHGADDAAAPPDAGSSTYCANFSGCESCAEDPSRCEQCELAGGRCVLACGGSTTACPRPAADACGDPLAPCTSAGADGQVCLVGTTMLRGSNDADFELAYPRRAFYVSPFWLDVHEVTVGRYRACVAAGDCTEPADPMHLTHLRDADPMLPVIGVTVAQATAFCRAAGGRLPTETEWERAAAGAHAQPFPWGTEVGCDRANWGHCVGGLVPVGSYPLGRSPEGVDDLMGNVWELTSDRIVPYLPDGNYTAFDPEPPCDPAHEARAGVDLFVSIRGGSWDSASETELARHPALRRARAPIDLGMPNTGFRCARDGT